MHTSGCGRAHMAVRVVTAQGPSNSHNLSLLLNEKQGLAAGCRSIACEHTHKTCHAQCCTLSPPPPS